MPLPLAVVGELVLAVLLLERFFDWHLRRALSRLDIGIMYFANPAGYVMSLHLSASAWLLGFGTLLWRFAPMLLAPRIDGREH